MQTQMTEETARAMIGYEDKSTGAELPAFLKLKAVAADFRSLDESLGGDEAVRRSSAEGKNGRHEETRTPDLYRVKVAL